MADPDRANSSATREPLLVHATLVSTSSEETVDLAVAGRFMARHATLIIVAASIGGLFCLALSYLFARTYRLEAVLEPSSYEDSSGDLAGLASRFGGIAGMLGVELGSVKKSTASSLAVLKSRQLITQFITENDLTPALYSSFWDRLVARFAVDDTGGPTPQDAYERFTRRVFSAREDRKTGLVVVEVEWPDARTGSQWANGIVAAANRLIAAQAATEAERNLEYLNKELRTTDDLRLREVIYSLVEKETARRMMARTRADYAFRVLDPAAPPSVAQYVKPRRILYLLFGVVAGAATGIVIALRRGGAAIRAPAMASRS